MSKRHEDVGTSTNTALTISLSPSDYNPLGCTRCGQVFANYRLWCERMTHSCAAFNDAHPVNAK